MDAARWYLAAPAAAINEVESRAVAACMGGLLGVGAGFMRKECRLLQQAFLELANSVEAGARPAQVSDAGQIGALTERLASLEARLLEQDRTVRHTLTMLIEWIEEDLGHRAAA